MYEKVCKMLAEQLDISADTITPQSEVVKDLGADSLDVVELMMALEDEYGITLPEGEVHIERAEVISSLDSKGTYRPILTLHGGGCEIHIPLGMA